MITRRIWLSTLRVSSQRTSLSKIMWFKSTICKQTTLNTSTWREMPLRMPRTFTVQEWTFPTKTIRRMGSPNSLPITTTLIQESTTGLYFNSKLPTWSKRVKWGGMQPILKMDSTKAVSSLLRDRARTPQPTGRVLSNPTNPNRESLLSKPDKTHTRAATPDSSVAKIRNKIKRIFTTRQSPRK